MTWVINQKLWHSSYLAFDIFSSAQAAASRETKQLKRPLRHHSDCHATINKTTIPYMTQCTDPKIINQSKTNATPQQCPGFYMAALAKGLLSCTLLMGLKLNVPLFLHRWTQGVRLSCTESSGEWWGRGPGVGDSPPSHHAAGDSSITLRGAASIINK